MRRCAPPLAALLLGSLVLSVPFAFGQSLSYPDQPDYEAFRRTEIETLAALTQEDPYRALTFRLLMSQRRLREAQLMVLKEKFQLVPPTLEAYGEAIQGVMETLQALPREALAAAGAYQSVEATGHRQQELLQTIARRAPQELNPAVEAALAASQQLRLFGEGMTRAPEAGLSTEGFGRKHSATIQEPLASEGALAEEEGISPLSPAASPKVKILQPAAPPPADARTEPRPQASALRAPHPRAPPAWYHPPQTSLQREREGLSPVPAPALNPTLLA